MDSSPVQCLTVLPLSSSIFLPSFVLLGLVLDAEGEQEDIAYCLTLLNYSEKAMRRLIDLEKCYAATLVNPDILNHFYTVVNKVHGPSIIIIVVVFIDLP